MAALLPLGAQTLAAVNPPGPVPRLEIGIDRSNMSTEWTLSPPAEPNIYPFNGSYNGTSVFEARRVAVFDGVARFHPQWFRDGFGPDSPQGAQLFVDMVRQVHARGMKLLAVVGHSASDFDPKDYIDPKTSGCQWGTYPLSKIDLPKFEQRVRVYFDAVKNAGLMVDAFEIGNELDLYCNDADMPKTSEFAAHGWKWFLTPAQVHAFAAGYAPFLKTYARLIREYFPSAKIITCGMSNPTGNSAALIQALANFTDSSGKTFDYTNLVDGYGTHTYPPSDTTQHTVQNATSDLAAQGALLPHNRQKPIWITEWSEVASVFWSSHKWSFQYDAHGKPGGDLNLAAGPYPAMTRAQAIETFRKDVVERLRTQPNPVNIGYLLYYSYDSEGKTDMCDGTGFNRSRNIKGTCFNGGEPHLRKQYYALAQYTRFIRPGFQIISPGGAFHTLAAYSRSAKRLVLITTNWDTPAGNDLDLTAFTGLPSSVTAYRTTAVESVNLREEKIAVSATGRIVDSLPLRSITTYVIDGVIPITNAPAGAIEGTHHVVSQATKLCMNITTNSTRAGDAIIPYSCGAFNNEEFNFVDEGSGFYSIQTVNGAASLCLNVSNGVGSPGDGKTRGGPGNLIQWNCGNGALPANELFEITPAGQGSYRIRARSSGLCLEDPGAGGTIRQNRCDAASANQIFSLID